MRHRDFEREYLEGAARNAGVGAIGFERDVTDRLAEGEVLYGVTALGRPMGELIRELREEGYDLGAWSVLAAQSEDMAELDEESRLLVQTLLQQVAGKGAEAVYLLRQIAELISK
jgi:hypothetical protein